MKIIITEDNYAEVLQALNKYEYGLKAHRDCQNIITTAERKAEERGIKRRDKEVVLGLYRQNISINTIALGTGLTEEQVINIINQQ